MRPVLVFHRDHCLACRSCELACSVAHSESGVLESALAEEFPPRRRVVLASGSDGVEALRCEQCLEPLCAFACKSGALRRDPATGRVTLDDACCVACYMCMTVCPFGIRPDPARDRVVRCDVCFGRATPACVEACPTGALSAGPPPARPPASTLRGAPSPWSQPTRRRTPGRCSPTLWRAACNRTKPIGAARATWKTSWECRYSAGAGRCASSPALGRWCSTTAPNWPSTGSLWRRAHGQRGFPSPARIWRACSCCAISKTWRRFRIGASSHLATAVIL